MRLGIPYHSLALHVIKLNTCGLQLYMIQVAVFCRVHVDYLFLFCAARGDKLVAAVCMDWAQLDKRREVP